MITDTTTFRCKLYSATKIHTVSNNRFRQITIFTVILLSWFITGCSTVKCAKLWAPETFGMDQIAPQIYVEKQLSEDQ